MNTKDPRFLIQQIEQSAWEKTTLANAAADAYAGHRAIVDEFLASRHEPAFKQLSEYLKTWSQEQLGQYVEMHRHESLQFVVMMLTGACNADCPICFTDRRRKANELEPEHRDQVLQQARQLGARYVYVPGEGEPTIDGGFWQFLDSCRNAGLHAIIFTNGLLLSDEIACRKYWKCTPDEAIERLKSYPVSFYFKFWSTDPSKVSEMMQIPAQQYHYTPYDGTPTPIGLHRLMDVFPRERVGIEVVVERRNADEVVNEIVPFAETHGLSRIVEMIQHNGRIFGDGSYDPTPLQAQRAKPLLSPTSCSLATCKAVITSRGFLSPRIAVLENQIPGTPVNVRSQDLFSLLHTTEYVVSRRYDILHCLCESIPNALAAANLGRKSSVQLKVFNVVPPSLTTTVGSETSLASQAEKTVAN